jgi:parallel beta-helix repeat protein
VDVHLIVLLFVYVALIVVNMFMSWLLKPASVEYYGHNAKRTAAVFVVLLIALYSGFTAGYMAYDSPLKEDALSITDTPEPAYGVLVPSTYEGMELTADGPVLVGAGETLSLVNSTLTFDPAPGMDWGLWVDEGGTLLVDNSTVRSSDPFEGFYIKVLGSVTVVDSELEGICDNVMDTDRSFWDMYYEYGFEVLSDGFSMRGTTVRDALGTGMMLNGVNATIEDCTFYRSGGSGIVASDSDVTVTNCTFVGCERGMNVWHSNLTVEGATFRSLQIGVMLHYSSSEISGSAFEECHDTAVWSEGGEPFLQDNTFDGNGRDAYAYDSEFGDFDRYFEWVMVFMAPVMFLFFAITEILGARLTKWWERRQKAKTEAMKGL